MKRKEIAEKVSKSCKGRVSPRKGCHLKESTKKLLREANLGKKHSKESYIKGIETRRKNGTLNHKEETKKKMSIASKGKKKSEEHKKNLKEAFNKPELKKIRRLTRLEQISKNYRNFFCNYNPSACEKFREFDKTNKTQGRYAMYGDGEFRIHKLGYSLDYINFDLKLIIEIDEKYHFEKSGKLREKDIIRQREIQKFYSDFKFLRFKDTEMDKILEIDICEGIKKSVKKYMEVIKNG
jgi:hypothetical protein